MDTKLLCDRLDKLANYAQSLSATTTIIQARDTIREQDEKLRSGMTQRDAAIHLRVPDSGDAVIDAMIEKAVIREAAQAAMVGMVSTTLKYMADHPEGTPTTTAGQKMINDTASASLLVADALSAALSAAGKRGGE